jgi:hypothetical protein
MKTLLIALLTLGTLHMATAQNYVRELDRKTGKPCLRGKITFTDIEKETVNSWFKKGVDAYEPNVTLTNELKSLAAPYRFVVFAGTWCEDTHNMLPKFYKTINMADIDLHAVEMYGVDRNKETLNLEHVFYNIKRIPTIIVMLQNREVGRIIENVNESIEADLLRIIEKDAKELEKKKAAKK